VDACVYVDVLLTGADVVWLALIDKYGGFGVVMPNAASML
jgi:hypothetical protein